MCNLYSLTKGRAAIRDWFRARHDYTGNLPLFPGIFPDQFARIVRRTADGERELVMARWGMPGPPQFGGQSMTNIRNVTSPHWRGWLGKRNRFVVPATSFCEYADTKPRKTPTWFALSEDRPLFAFAGLWTPWRGVRGPKSAPIEGEHELFGFLTTVANAVVAPIHPKAMPVILTSPAEVDRARGGHFRRSGATKAAAGRRAQDCCEGRKGGRSSVGSQSCVRGSQTWPRQPDEMQVSGLNAALRSDFRSGSPSRRRLRRAKSLSREREPA
jgi:putative SOS response-associated peptidase YedK